MPGASPARGDHATVGKEKNSSSADQQTPSCMRETSQGLHATPWDAPRVGGESARVMLWRALDAQRRCCASSRIEFRLQHCLRQQALAFSARRVDYERVAGVAPHTGPLILRSANPRCQEGRVTFELPIFEVRIQFDRVDIVGLFNEDSRQSRACRSQIVLVHARARDLQIDLCMRVGHCSRCFAVPCWCDADDGMCLRRG
jgi:hypothetical protein